MSLMSQRRSIYTRTPTRTRIIPQTSRTANVPTAIMSRSSTTMGSLYRGRGASLSTRTRIIPQSIRTRPTVRISARPTVTIPTRPTFTIRRPIIPTGIIPTIIPTSTAPLPGGGLPSPSITGGWFGLGDIGGNIKAFGGNILDQFKTLIPTAIKIIAAVVVIKIVLWLVKGRRR